jgi:ABC-type bacteriocin/lantibiotic exporter with double-glycine peptidase domain
MLTGLSVPHYPQQADGLCLPACAQMVLAYWGIRRTQDRLARALKTIPGAGTPGSCLRDLASRNLAVHYGEGAIHELRLALTQAIPPIILVNTKHLPHWRLETAHAVVLLAMDDNQVMINDPGSNQGRLVIGLDEFLLAWDEMANLFGLIRKI